MALRIVTDKKELDKKGIKYVDYNDIWFQSVSLKDNEVTRHILSYIDKAQYASSDTFIGRDEKLGALNKTLLSTGCKTLLNIVYNPDICFSVAECGPNALEALSFIDEGIIFWDKPVLFLIEDMDCNIEYDGKHYSKYMSFLHDVMN